MLEGLAGWRSVEPEVLGFSADSDRREPSPKPPAPSLPAVSPSGSRSATIQGAADFSGQSQLAFTTAVDVSGQIRLASAAAVDVRRDSRRSSTATGKHILRSSPAVPGARNPAPEISRPLTTPANTVGPWSKTPATPGNDKTLRGGVLDDARERRPSSGA